MRIKALSIATIVTLGAVGCGGGDGDPAAAPSPTSTRATLQAAAASRALTIRMTEFAFAPQNAVVKAGRVTLTTPNDRRTVHELVLLKTGADPANLPKTGDGKVDETMSVGEIPDVEPGTTKKARFKLAAGKYALVCALPGHYESGMYASLTVR